MPKTFTMFSSFLMASLALTGCSYWMTKWILKFINILQKKVLSIILLVLKSLKEHPITHRKYTRKFVEELNSASNEHYMEQLEVEKQKIKKALGEP